ncbi:hypothetical protein [Flavobacterium sp.]|uniref:hypothetical protein n=1 Tax=Flavobacterium sp. TaxID=239 RepID=UPI00262D4BA7|nr:hypothetical protein [Flavobacterium sp.]
MNNAFYDRISRSTAHRNSREDNAHYILENPDKLPALFQIAVTVNDKNHHKACWILELIFETDIQLSGPFLDPFCTALPHWKVDGAVRSASKICMMLSQQHSRQPFLSQKQVAKLSESCFDWLISDVKVAPKAYAMRALFELGKSERWIYPELKIILSEDFTKHSAAYKGAAKDILRKIG